MKLPPVMRKSLALKPGNVAATWFHVPPLIVNVLALTAPLAVTAPAVRFKLLTLLAPFKASVPATETCPDVAPFNGPLSVALPPADTVKAPPSVVVPDTASEPPDTLSELPELMVKAAIASVPLACVTARPELIRAVSLAAGRLPVLQFVAVVTKRKRGVTAIQSARLHKFAPIS